MTHRSTRRAIHAWTYCLIAAFLFMQMATAAYACPLFSQQHDAASSMSADMPCAQMMAKGTMSDDAQPGLCVEHCKAGTQSVEPGHALGVPMAVLMVLFALALAIVAPTAISARAAIARTRNRAPPVAHSILHCCYRI